MMHLDRRAQVAQASHAQVSAWLRGRFWAVALLVLAALAVGLRVWGLSFGLPYRYHIDETFYVAGALRMASNGFNLPITTHGPNLFYVLLLAEDALYFALMWLTGAARSVAAFEQLYRSDPSVFVLLARFTSVAAGMLTLVPVFLIGERLHGRSVGLVAAVLLAFNYQHIRESHFGTPDVFSGLLVAFCLLVCVALAQSGRTRDYVLWGLFGGLATGTKFTNVLLWLPLGVAHWTAVSRQENGRTRISGKRVLSSRLFAAALSFVLAFAVAYPNVLLRPSAFLEYVRFLVSVGEAGFITQFTIEPAPAWVYYLYSLTWGMGWVLLACVGLGVVLATLRRRTGDLLLLSFVVAYVIFLCRAPYYASRYLVPVLPALCVFAAHGLHALVSWLVPHTAKSSAVCALFVGLIALQPLACSVRLDYLLVRKDTRTIAKEWMEANIAAGAKIAVDWAKHAPPLRTTEDPFPLGDVAYEVLEAGGIGLPRYSLDEYRDAGTQYLVMSSFIDDIELSSALDAEARGRFHNLLDEQCDLVYEVKPYQGQHEPPFVFDQIFGPVTTLWQFERPGPTIKVYRLK